MIPPKANVVKQSAIVCKAYVTMEYFEQGGQTYGIGMLWNQTLTLCLPAGNKRSWMKIKLIIYGRL